MLLFRNFSFFILCSCILTQAIWAISPEEDTTDSPIHFNSASEEDIEYINPSGLLVRFRNEDDVANVMLDFLELSDVINLMLTCTADYHYIKKVGKTRFDDEKKEGILYYLFFHVFSHDLEGSIGSWQELPEDVALFQQKLLRGLKADNVVWHPLDKKQHTDLQNNNSIDPQPQANASKKSTWYELKRWFKTKATAKNAKEPSFEELQNKTKKEISNFPEELNSFVNDLLFIKKRLNSNHLPQINFLLALEKEYAFQITKMPSDPHERAEYYRRSILHDEVFQQYMDLANSGHVGAKARVVKLLCEALNHSYDDTEARFNKETVMEILENFSKQGNSKARAALMKETLSDKTLGKYYMESDNIQPKSLERVMQLPRVICKGLYRKPYAFDSMAESLLRKWFQDSEGRELLSHQQIQKLKEIVETESTSSPLTLEDIETQAVEDIETQEEFVRWLAEEPNQHNGKACALHVLLLKDQLRGLLLDSYIFELHKIFDQNRDSVQELKKTSLSDFYQQVNANLRKWLKKPEDKLTSDQLQELVEAVEKERPSSQPVPEAIATLEAFTKWLAKRSDQENGEAHIFLAYTLSSFLIDRKEKEQEGQYIQKLKSLTQQGNEYAQFELAQHWRFSDDKQKALLNLRRMAREGNKLAHEILIESLVSGGLGQKTSDLKERLQELRHSATKQNNRVAQKYLIELLKGVIENSHLFLSDSEKGWKEFFASTENKDLRKEILDEVIDFTLLGNRKAQKFIAKILSNSLDRDQELSFMYCFDTYNALLEK